MKSELIEEWPEFETLETEWNELLGNSRANSIFLTWEWLKSWFEVTDRFVKPFAIIVRDTAGRLLGVAPFYVGEYRLLRLLPYRTLRVMGDYATGMDYPDWIIHKDHETDVSLEIARRLSKSSDRWDCLWMTGVAGWTGAFDRVVQACQNEGFYCHVRPRDFGYLNLPSSMDSFMQCLSKNTRQQLKRQMKKIFGRDEITIFRCRKSDDLPGVMDALFDLHHRRWKRVGDEGTFRRKPAEALFYREFTRVALQKGWLWLFGLQDHGEFKAIQIGYVYQNTFHQMQEGFDPDYLPGAGNALRAKVIEACIADGLRAYDFLGEMSEHKRKWLAEERLGWDFFVGCKSNKNRLLFLREIWPTGRYLRPSLVRSSRKVLR